MEVCAEAKRVMVQALSKMYSSRTQRGGIPLHRSLLLTLVMRAARDAYHSARGPVPNPGPDTSGQRDTAHRTQPEERMDTAEAPEPPCALQSAERPAEPDSTADKENCNSTGHQAQSRKRRGKSGAEPDFLPCKKARLDRKALRRVFHDSTAQRNSGQCARETELLPASHIPRTIVTC